MFGILKRGPLTLKDTNHSDQDVNFNLILNIALIINEQ